MENVTRMSSSKQAAMAAVVRLDNSAVHFKNNKLSDNLSCTLDALFRKKNTARINQRNLASKTRKDYEYLLAVQEVAKREHKKASRGISTSATARQPSTQAPVNNGENSGKPAKEMIKARGYGKSHSRSNQTPKQQQNLRLKLHTSSPDSSHSSSSSVLSDVTCEQDSIEDDESNDESLKHEQLPTTGAPSSIFRGALWQQKSNAMLPKTFDQHRQTSRARRHQNKVWAVDNSTKDRSTISGRSHFRYTRGPSYNQTRKSGYVSHTKSLMDTVVYDPGDVFLMTRPRGIDPRAALKMRAKTALGVTSADAVQDGEIDPSDVRMCQSAGLSRRKLREMNNIDALIETSETPLFFDRRKILLQNAKHEFQTLQSRVRRFLEDVDRFKKMSATAKDPMLFFLES